MPHATLFQISIAPNWSKYIIEYLTQHLLPKTISKVQRKTIEIEAKDFEIIADQLYKRGKDKQLRLCITETKYIRVLEQAHASLSRGHLFVDTMAKAIMTAGLWCTTLFQDADEYVKQCDDCQRTKVPIRKDNMPLRPMMGARAFAKWGIDFVGP